MGSRGNSNRGAKHLHATKCYMLLGYMLMLGRGGGGAERVGVHELLARAERRAEKMLQEMLDESNLKWSGTSNTRDSCYQDTLRDDTGDTGSL